MTASLSDVRMSDKFIDIRYRILDTGLDIDIGYIDLDGVEKVETP